MIRINFKPHRCLDGVDPLSVAISGGSSLIGGILGYSATKDASKRALKAQRETNATNLQIANANNALQEQMFNRQLQYNSPAEQRRMLQEAGYSPYALLGNQGSYSATSPAAPALQQAVMQSEPYLPNTYLADSVSKIGSEVGNFVSAVADARKSRAEAKNLEIQNQYAEQKQINDLLLSGQSVEAQRLANQYSRESMEDRLLNNTLNNDFINKQSDVLAKQSLQLEIDNRLRGKINEATLKQILANAKSLDANASLAKVQETLVSKQGLKVDAEIKSILNQIAVDWYNAHSQRISANAQSVTAQSVKSLNSSLSKVYDAQSTQINITNGFLKRYGEMKQVGEIAKLWIDIRNGRATTDQIISLANMYTQMGENFRKQNQWYAWKQCAEITESISRTLSNVSGMFTGGGSSGGSTGVPLPSNVTTSYSIPLIMP